MKKNKMKKVLVNGFLASAICVNMIGCDDVEAEIEKEPEREQTISTTTSITTPEPTTETTIVVTENKEQTMTMEDVIKINQDFVSYVKTQTQNMDKFYSNLGYSGGFTNLFPTDDYMCLIYVVNRDYISNEEAERMINDGLIPKDSKDLFEKYNDQYCSIIQTNDSYLSAISENQTIDNLIQIDMIVPEKYKNVNNELHENILERYENSSEDNKNTILSNGYITNYEINADSTGIDYFFKEYYDLAGIMRSIALYNTEELNVLQTIVDENENNTKLYYENNYSNSKVLIKK